jgi:toxin-antitoxin system PIN domain toxin
VTVLDANVLLYAYNADAPQHAAAAAWLNELFSGQEMIGLPWATIWAFLRISTNARLWPNPKPAKEAFEIVREWLDRPGIVILEPGPRHVQILERLVMGHRVSGPMVSDAVMAAIALEYGAILASTDRDFSRFTDLRWINPAP